MDKTAQSLMVIVLVIIVTVGGWIYGSSNRSSCGDDTKGGVHPLSRSCGNRRGEAAPQGATARCDDGTYSYSKDPYGSGTCSQHGGVSSFVQ